MLRRLLVALVALVGGLLGAPGSSVASTTTAIPAAISTYDALAIVRARINECCASDAGQDQHSDDRESSAPHSATARGTSTTSLALSNATKFDGEFVYRVHGGGSGPWGHSWTTENPLQMAYPRDTLGLPKVNSGEYVTCARVCNTDGVIRREALPLDGTTGGGAELLFPDPVRQLEHVWTVRPGTPL
jgi:hypothetical protein